MEKHYIQICDGAAPQAVLFSSWEGFKCKTNYVANIVMLSNTLLSLVICSRPLNNKSIRWEGGLRLEVCLHLILFCICMSKAQENHKLAKLGSQPRLIAGYAIQM